MSVVKGKKGFQVNPRLDFLEGVLRRWPDQWIYVGSELGSRQTLHVSLERRLGAGDVVIRQRGGLLYAVYLTVATAPDLEAAFVKLDT